MISVFCFQCLCPNYYHILSLRDYFNTIIIHIELPYLRENTSTLRDFFFLKYELPTIKFGGN